MKKIVIYTALFGNYDVLSSPINLSKDFDYICFTDKPKKNSKSMEGKIYQTYL